MLGFLSPAAPRRFALVARALIVGGVAGFFASADAAAQEEARPTSRTTATAAESGAASRPSAEGRASRPRRGRAATSEANYVRVAGRGDEKRLETGWKTFLRDDGRAVILVGAVHVADPEYFAALDALLGRVDFVFYEGVSGEPTPEMTMIGRLQLALGKLLELAFQKDGVRYGRPHFVHADLDGPEIARRLAARGESLLPGGPGFKMFGPFLAGFLERAAASSERDRRAGRPGAGAALKSSAADLLADAGRLGDLRSRAFDDIVIGDRNAHAMRTLEPFLERGPGVFALFYGAAHLPDFERRLAALGFRGGASGFIPAWRLGARAPRPEAPSDLGVPDRGRRPL